MRGFLENRKALLDCRVVAINDADAATLKTHLDNLLGHGAVIGVDARTNSLLVTGTPSCMQMRYLPHR